MEHVWSALAREDRLAIMDFIATDNPRAAVEVDEHISLSCDRLRNYPQSGRIGRVEGTRELVVSGTAYIVIYRVSVKAVIIWRVLHGARQWPPERK